MQLLKAKTSRKAREYMSRIIKREIKVGVPQKQAVAMAYSMARKKRFKV